MTNKLDLKTQTNKDYISMQCGTGKTLPAILSLYKSNPDVFKPKSQKINNENKISNIT